MTVSNWTDGYFSVHARAVEARGEDCLDDVRWPRTTGADAIAIVALYDDAIMEHGSAGLVERWERTRDKLGLALLGLRDAYAENRDLWSVIADASVYLDDSGVESPETETWDALTEPFAVLRNGTLDVPFGPFPDAKTHDEIYLAQYKFLREHRGEDSLPAPAGMVGFPKPIPRTTNADVLQLASYWSQQLERAPHVFGTDSVVAAWQRTMTDIQAAKNAPADAVYAKNNEFWRTLGNTEVHVAAAKEAPTSWDLAKASIAFGVTNLPSTLATSAGKAEDALSSVVHGAAEVASDVGHAIVKSFKTPLFIGAGVVGLWLLLRK
ncbi:MAG TPA: hypothetical protein VGC41_10270 [Kofleriaceae bacterium]